MLASPVCGSCCIESGTRREVPPSAFVLKQRAGAVGGQVLSHPLCISQPVNCAGQNQSSGIDVGAGQESCRARNRSSGVSLKQDSCFINPRSCAHNHIDNCDCGPSALHQQYDNRPHTCSSPRIPWPCALSGLFPCSLALVLNMLCFWCRPRPQPMGPNSI